MTSEQHNLFGALQPKQKAKALPRREPVNQPAPIATRPLTHAELAQRDKNLAAIRDYRAKCKVGDIRIAEGVCDGCGGERDAELVHISKNGLQLWEARCLTCNGTEP